MTKRTVDAKDPVKKVDGVSSNQAAGDDCNDKEDDCNDKEMQKIPLRR